MPIYEYQCQSCNTVFEKIQKFSDAPVTVHEACGGPVERLLSAPQFQFKGSGWYITDYAKSGSNSPAQSGGKEPKSETKSEAKTEAKTETKAKSESSSTPTPAAAPATSSTNTSNK